MMYLSKNPKMTERECLIEFLDSAIEYGEITKKEAREHLKWYDDNFNTIIN